jgi:predicted DCC family thiol-disulfide oxidoreductase YuxK
MDATRNGTALVLYDGVCAMCNGIVRFILDRDPDGQFRFAALQSDVARQALRRHGRNPDDLDTMYLLSDFEQPSERIFARSTAILETCRRLGGIWGGLSWLRIFPAPARDFVYGLLVKNRYRVFGKHDSGPIAPPQWRDRFIGDSRS